MMHAMRNLARGAFFLSGIAGLTFEIVWVRHLGLALGTTTLAVATTTAAYMGGLALGSHLGGRIADRLRRPLAWYGAVEMFIAALGAVVPLVCTRLPQINAWLTTDIAVGSWPQALMRLAAAFAVLIVPTVAMGATLPVLARTVANRVATVGREVGILYALNTSGAVLGAAFCGFWWIPSLGLSATNNIAVGLDLLLGGTALAMGVLLPSAELPAQDGVGTAIWRPGSRTLVALLALTGASAMALQVLWTRALGTALGPSTYAFSAIVCAYLTGLAIGGWVAARVADRIEHVRLALLLAFLVTGTFALVGVAWVDDLPALLHAVVLQRDLTIEGLVRAEFLLAALSVLPATVGMGALFPLTLSAVAGNDQRLGAAVGRAYATNTLGAIVGSFAGALVLLPLFGVEGGMRAAAMGYVIAALVLAWRLEPSVHGAVRWGSAALAVLLGVGIVGFKKWDVGQWTAGLYRLSMTRTYYADSKFEPSKIIFHEDGLASTVTVEEDSGVRWIKVNGKIDGSNVGDMPTQILSGLLPMMVHPSPENVAVIGCGSCVTVGAALQAEPRKVTLVELEKQVVAAAHLFSEVNHAPWESPRVEVVEDDGRNFLARSKADFDVIISEPSNPWMTGASSLFTQEFFQTAQTRLKSDGMFVQWLQIYELAPDRIASVLKTFHSVFPSVVVFSAHTESNDLLLLGSKQAIALDWEQLHRRFDKLQPELARADLRTPEELLALVLFTDKQIDTLPTSIPLNTDDNAFIEFGAPRDLVAFAEDDPSFPLLESVQGKRASIMSHLIHSETPLPGVIAQLAHGYLKQGMLEDARAAVAMLQEPTLNSSPEDLDEGRNVVDISDLLTEEDRERVVDTAVLNTKSEFATAVDLFAKGEESAALTHLEANPSAVNQSAEHVFFYGYLLYRNEQYEAARKVLHRAWNAADAEPLRPAIAYYMARNAYYDGDYKRAVQDMQRYRETQNPALTGLQD